MYSLIRENLLKRHRPIENVPLVWVKLLKRQSLGSMAREKWTKKQPFVWNIPITLGSNCTPTPTWDAPVVITLYVKLKHALSTNCTGSLRTKVKNNYSSKTSITAWASIYF